MGYRTTTQSLLMLLFSRTLVQSKHSVSYRPLRKIGIAAFKADILKSFLIRDPKGHLSDLCKQYYHVLNALPNKHAPITTKSVSQKPAAWMTPDILQSKRHRRYIERAWRKSRSTLDSSRYSKLCLYCNIQMAKAKSDYYTKLI